ncbi:hypothetical protein, partial [Mycobacterium uberis]
MQALVHRANDVKHSDRPVLASSDVVAASRTDASANLQHHTIVWLSSLSPPCSVAYIHANISPNVLFCVVLCCFVLLVGGVEAR